MRGRPGCKLAATHIAAEELSVRLSDNSSALWTELPGAPCWASHNWLNTAYGRFLAIEESGLATAAGMPRLMRDAPLGTGAAGGAGAGAAASAKAGVKDVDVCKLLTPATAPWMTGNFDAFQVLWPVPTTLQNDSW